MRKGFGVGHKLDHWSSIYDGLKNVRVYQDGNKAYPKNFWWTISLSATTFHPSDKLMIYHSMYICSIFLVKTSDTLHHIYTFFLSCLVHIGWCDTVRIIYIWIALPKVAKASMGEESRWDITNIFDKKLGHCKWAFISKFGFVPFRHHYLTLV
jgi:hypothetical protein